MNKNGFFPSTTIRKLVEQTGIHDMKYTKHLSQLDGDGNDIASYPQMRVIIDIDGQDARVAKVLPLAQTFQEYMDGIDAELVAEADPDADELAEDAPPAEEPEEPEGLEGADGEEQKDAFGN